MAPPESTSPSPARSWLGLALPAIAAGALVLAVAELMGWPIGAICGRWLAVLGFVLYGLKRRSLTAWILIAMVVGIAIGLDGPPLTRYLGGDWATAVQPWVRLLSQVFLRLIKTIIAPLLFATLVVGIAGHADLKQVGRMGVKALIYFEVVTTLALFIGLAAINISKAGVGIAVPTELEQTDVKGQKQTAPQVVLNAFPENVAKAVSEGHVLQIVVFAVLFGIALALAPEERRRPMLGLCESLAEVMFKFTKLVMYFAPIGVGAAITYTVGHLGLGILVNLFKLLATLYVALAFFALVVLLPVALWARVPLRRFAQALAEPVSIAFATTSSEAALPLAMQRMEQLGVPRSIVAFVMPTGYSFNLDGSTLYLALASIFVAQAGGIALSLPQQLAIVFTLMLTSKGVAGVPRATLVILLGTAASFGLPEWPILAILGIDELMDMARTSVNVVGNCLATAVVARWEGEYPPKEQPPA